MRYVSRIDDIERRAARLNVSLHRVCREAGVRQNNLTRWKAGMSPTVAVLERDLHRLEAALDRMERELLDELSRETRPRGESEMRSAV